MAEYTLSDAEWADALRVAFEASNKARFEDNNPEGAADIGVQAGIARAQEIGRRRLGLG